MIPIVWWTGAPNTIAAGYWDQAMLLDIFNAEAADVSSYYSVCEPPAVTRNRLSAHPAAICVVPARHHVDAVDRVNELLSAFQRVVVVLTGDEEHRFPSGQLEHPDMQQWVMTPNARTYYGDKVGMLSTGYTPHTSHRAAPRPTKAQLYDISFAGQVTHRRRHECYQAINQLPSYIAKRLDASQGFTQGLPPYLYVDRLHRSRFVACPSGPECVDTFRVWEALQVGAVPLCDTQTPTRHEGDYWSLVAPDVPLPTIDEWTFDELMPWLRMPADAYNELRRGLLDAWAQHKDALRARFRAQIEWLGEL